MKNARQGEIIKIIQSMDVETQDQLLEELRARGYNTTQATISRDIKELRMVKELSKNGGYRYTMSQRKPSTEVDGRLRTNFQGISLDFTSSFFGRFPLCQATMGRS